MKRGFSVVLIVMVAAVAMFGGQWYMYVTQGSELYDEVGIELNSRAPGPLRAWGCEKLHARFPDKLPPLGCGAGDGRNWM